MHLFFITLLSFICTLNAKCLCSEGAIENFGEIDFNATIKNLAKSIEYLTAQGNLF